MTTSRALVWTVMKFFVLFAQEVYRFKNESVEVISYPAGPNVVSEKELERIEYVNVYIGEYVMKKWQGRSIWNLYHAGMAFEPCFSAEIPSIGYDPQLLYVIDYNALNDEDILPFILPSNDFPEPHSTFGTLGEMIANILNFYTSSNALSLQWANTGQLRLVNTRPPEYTNFTFIGRISTQSFKEFRIWAVKNWTETADTFELFTVVDVSWEMYYLRARICHEFVEDAVARLMEVSMIPSALANPLFRDTVVFYASDVRPVDVANAREVRDLIRFFRVLAYNWQSFSSSFAKARELVAKLRSLGMRIVVFSGGRLHWMHVADGFLDYCYIERRISAGDRVPQKLCLASGSPVDFHWDFWDWLMFIEINTDTYISEIFTTTVILFALIYFRKQIF